MSASAVRQADIQRVLRAYRAEGLPVPAVRIDRAGAITVLPTARLATPDEELDAMIEATDGKDGA